MSYVSMISFIVMICFYANTLSVYERKKNNCPTKPLTHSLVNDNHYMLSNFQSKSSGGNYKTFEKVLNVNVVRVLCNDWYISNEWLI